MNSSERQTYQLLLAGMAVILAISLWLCRPPAAAMETCQAKGFSAQTCQQQLSR